MRSSRVALLSLSLLAIGLVVTLGSSSPEPNPILSWDISLSNVASQRLQPNDQLFVLFDLSVKPVQSDGYELEKITVEIQLWKFRKRTTAEGTTVIDMRELTGSPRPIGTFSSPGTPFSISRAGMVVATGICGTVAAAMAPGADWGHYLLPKGPADGFILVFVITAQGNKEGVPVFGGATFTVQLDHTELCGG